MPGRGSRSADQLYRELPPSTMTREREAELAARWREHGDIEAANELACGHLRFAAMVAGRYHRRHPSVAISDLNAAAFYGLLDAAKKFDGSRGSRFCSYAAYRVNQMCRLELAKLESPVKLPNAVTQGIAVVKEFYNLPENSQRRPHTSDVDEIMASAQARRQWSLQRSFVEMAVVAQHCHRALDAEISNSSEAKSILTHKDLIPSNLPAPDDGVAAKDRASLLRSAVADLPYRERMIIERYFLGDENGDTISLEDIAQEIGLTRERIRQLKNRGLELLRRALGSELHANMAD